MASYVFRGLGVIAAAGAFALTATPAAEASVTLEGCTITALNPTPVKLTNDGRKVAEARFSIRCAPQRRVETQYRLYGDDPVFDDALGAIPRDHGWFVAGAYQEIGEASDFFSPSCNEDVPGADEVYSRVRIRVHLPGGLNAAGVDTAWSAWDRGPTVTYYC
jgi:hypothetical protein